MKTIDTIVSQALHTAEADQRMQEADAQFAATFVSLSSERQAGCWRGLTHAEKSRLIVRRIEAIGKDWTPAVVAAFIAKYDERFAAGPLDAAIEGALERLAFDNAQRAETADKADRAFFRRNATAYTNALDQYRKGVRPEILGSGARLIPSSQPGKPAHIVRLDGDWVCSCCASSSMHWPIALCIGIEQAFEDMQQYDDGNCDPPNEPSPLGPDEGDSIPSARHIGQRLAEARRMYLVAA